MDFNVQINLSQKYYQQANKIVLISNIHPLLFSIKLEWFSFSITDVFSNLGNDSEICYPGVSCLMDFRTIFLSPTTIPYCALAHWIEMLRNVIHLTISYLVTQNWDCWRKILNYKFPNRLNKTVLGSNVSATCVNPKEEWVPFLPIMVLSTFVTYTFSCQLGFWKQKALILQNPRMYFYFYQK